MLFIYRHHNSIRFDSSLITYHDQNREPGPQRCPSESLIADHFLMNGWKMGLEAHLKRDGASWVSPEPMMACVKYSYDKIFL